MLYRRPVQLALQAALLLAMKADDNPRCVSELAGRLGVPATYLAKILQSLSRAGLLSTARGPGGGVRLARPAREIHLLDILLAVEPKVDFERCFLGLDSCDDRNPCPLHDTWVPIRARILAMLQTTNLGRLAAKAKRRGVLRSKTGVSSAGSGLPTAVRTVGVKRNRSRV
ncbi:MAG: RrF2 family transcriptional regulator [Acidobacteriota bacterium]